MRWFSKTSTGLRITSLLQEEEKNVNLHSNQEQSTIIQINFSINTYRRILKIITYLGKIDGMGGIGGMFF